MKVTLEMLEKYDACPDGINFMKKYYPDGAEAMEIMDNPKVTLEMLHFAVRFFPYTKEEFKRYKELCKIENSKHFFYSEDLNNCIAITKSKHIFNSEFVKHSKNVKKSKYIYNCKNIDTCEDVLESLNIVCSNKIIESKQVEYSTEIYKSNIVTWSKYIFSSLRILDSSFIYQSINLQDCYFCGFLNGCKHCLFCSDLTDKEYYVFNQQVTPDRFEEIKGQINDLLALETPIFIEIDQQKHRDDRFKISTRFDAIFDGLSPDFFGWVGSLEEYSKEVFFQLFLTREI